jgi:hypothetical protein
MIADSPAVSNDRGEATAGRLLDRKARRGACRANALAVSALAFAVAIAGCGGSSSGVTPASYRARVNNICARANAKITALPASTNNSVAGLNEQIAIAKSALTQIKAIAPPSSMSAGVRKWVGVSAQQAADADQVISALKAGKTSQAGSLAAKGAALNSPVNAEAKSLGLPSCAANPRPSGPTQTSPLQAFKSGYEQLRGPLNQTGAAIGVEVQHASGQTDAQLRAAFQQLASRFQSQLSQLETLKPPQNLAADWNSVLDSAHRIESDLIAVVAAAATHSRSAGEQAGASLAADAQALQSAAATIKAKLGIK